MSNKNKYILLAILIIFILFQLNNALFNCEFKNFNLNKNPELKAKLIGKFFQRFQTLEKKSLEIKNKDYSYEKYSLALSNALVAENDYIEKHNLEFGYNIDANGFYICKRTP